MEAMNIEYLSFSVRRVFFIQEFREYGSYFDQEWAHRQGDM
jgi:hypothetical protein